MKKLHLHKSYIKYLRNNYNYSFDAKKNVSSPEDIILSEHVEESLPRELCDQTWGNRNQL
jgi:hypothetical protein